MKQQATAAVSLQQRISSFYQRPTGSMFVPDNREANIVRHYADCIEFHGMPLNYAVELVLHDLKREIVHVLDKTELDVLIKRLEKHPKKSGARRGSLAAYYRTLDRLSRPS